MIMLYPLNFECPSVRPSVIRPSVRQRFVSVLTLVPFDLFSSNFA